MLNTNSILEKLVLQALKVSPETKEDLEGLKRKFSSRERIRMLSSPQILGAYRRLVKSKKIKPDSQLERLLKLRKVRTISGVTPLAIFTKPFPCPGECVYCPDQAGMPKSYLDDEPAVMRAIAAGFSAKKQVRDRIKALKTIGHPTDKIELIVMGGTFSAMAKDDRLNFIIEVLRECNGNKAQSAKLKAPSQSCLKTSRSIPTRGAGRRTRLEERFWEGRQNYNAKLKVLREMQKLNEKARHRLVGVTFETRPDWVDEEEVKFLRLLGGTRVELGVQSLDDEILKKVKRGHKVEATMAATRLLKDAGFKVCYHLMPNLPGSDLSLDLKMFKEVFTNPDYCPDMVKIYPCLVTRQAPFYKWYKNGQFKPYSDQELIELLVKIKRILPEWVRVNRLGRDIPVGNIAEGTKISNIRQVAAEEMKKRGWRCQCIRCREVKNLEFRSLKIGLRIIEYRASGGKEYFLQYVDKNNRLYTLLRLRTPGKKVMFKALKGAAIVRELHTYGPAVPIGKEAQVETQHRGLGKKLLEKAEKITEDEGLEKIAVIAGVGARDYYRKLGYELEDSYMVKCL